MIKKRLVPLAFFIGMSLSVFLIGCGTNETQKDTNEPVEDITQPDEDTNKPIEDTNEPAKDIIPNSTD